MSNVKIYTAVSEDLSPLIQGEGFCTDMVRYSDYAALEAKCAALAAEKEKFAVECAAAKIAIAYLKSGRQDFTLNTPSTDAFLAEVRAQGVEMAVAMFVEESQHLPNETNSVLRDVEGMADLIRKGGTH